jgi:hypothetical protein
LARKFKTLSLTLLVFCLLALASIWLGVKWWPFHAPRDYEECSENAETIASSKDGPDAGQRPLLTDSSLVLT